MGWGGGAEGKETKHPSGLKWGRARGEGFSFAARQQYYIPASSLITTLHTMS